MHLPAASLLIFCATALGCSEAPEGQPAAPERAREEAGSDAGELDDLRALGYVSFGDPLDDEELRLGVLVHDPERVAPGLNLISNARLCRTELVDMDGVVRHAWEESSSHWDNTVLLPDGDLLVVGRLPNEETYESRWNARYLLRLGWDGSERWRRMVPVHHDVEITPAGDILTLTYDRKLIKRVHPEAPTNNHYLSLYSAAGEELESVSLWRLLNSAPELFTLQAIGARMHYGSPEVDLFHSNSIEWLRDAELAERDPIYGLDNILVSVRHQDTLAIVNWKEKKLVWAWGQGEISGPHDATLLANGHILAFDNGLARGWSRVIEVDPLRREIVWEYGVPGTGGRLDPEAPGSYFTATRGANQRLSNGNTLITNSVHGQVFEVTREGELVWFFQDPKLTENNEPSVLVRARRLEGVSLEDLEARRAAGQALPRVD